ncbi:hypothetical protein J6590_087500 [Homalodisca vitripennis]|nr:hypothetical protein J6590_087500 [Homalodisca vitripennis]
MANAKKRAGLFVLDAAGNTCCVARSLPYHVSSRRTCDERQKQRENCRPDVFLEMFQIPRGMKERGDRDLIETATREFCEETLCVNSPLFVLDEPTQLYWNDAGKRWSYTIYIAKTRHRLYFAFDPSRMVTTVLNLSGVSDDFHSYTVHTTPVSYARSDGTVNRLVVINVMDYIDYMRNCQLHCYGENNYAILLEKLSEQCVALTPEGVFYCPTSVTDGAVKEIPTITPEIFQSIKNCQKNSQDVYAHDIDIAAYSNESNNKYFYGRWKSFWNGIDERVNRRVLRDYIPNG